MSNIIFKGDDKARYIRRAHRSDFHSKIFLAFILIFHLKIYFMLFVYCEMHEFVSIKCIKYETIEVDSVINSLHSVYF